MEALRRHAQLQAQGTKVFPGTTTTNTTDDPAVPEVSTTGDHDRIFTPHGAPTAPVCSVMTARSAQHDAAAAFTNPGQVNHRRYEALRAFYVDGLSYAEAAERFGYTRWTAATRVS